MSKLISINNTNLYDDFIVSLERIKNGRSEKSVLIVGADESSKAIAIKNIAMLAVKDGCHCIYLKPPNQSESSTLPEMLVNSLWRMLLDLNTKTSSLKIKRALSVTKSFILAYKLPLCTLDFFNKIEIEAGEADTGDLEFDLPALLIIIGELAKERLIVLTFFIEKLQLLNGTELSALIMALHRISQKSLPIKLVATISPELIKIIGDSKEYAERLFLFQQVSEC